MPVPRMVAAFALFALSLAVLPESNAQDEPKKEIAKAALKRLDKLTDEDLRKQLLFVPEIGYDQAGAKLCYTPINEAISSGKVEQASIPADFGVRFYANLAANFKRPDWMALPWRAGPDSQLGKESAERLQVFSSNLRSILQESATRKDIRPNPEKVRAAFDGDVTRKRGEQDALKWDKSESIPTLMQMLQTENTDIRSFLVKRLSQIDGKESTFALAQRAVFDLSPEVREEAVTALATRDRKHFEQFLIDALRSPWPAAAEHAAEVIAALQIKNAVPGMVKLLKEPDPRLPFTTDGKNYVIREMVRVNHLSNCMLCHAISTSKEDLVRGRVPTPGEDMPPLYYAEQSGLFVRADITFIRQDFSVVQPVANPIKWPGQQRFDYLVRARNATPKEVKLLKGLEKEGKLSASYEQREAILFALRETTKTDRGSRTESWLELLGGIEQKKQRHRNGARIASASTSCS